jgi:hypothetical protein
MCSNHSIALDTIVIARADAGATLGSVEEFVKFGSTWMLDI